MLIKKEGKDKMLVQRCDICKTELKMGDMPLLMWTHRLKTRTVWDICIGCISKIKELAGDGRVFESKRNG